MPVVEAVVVVLALLAAVAVAVAVGVVGRRRVLERRGGTVELWLRVRPQARGGGWASGVGRFVGGELQWYRALSLAPRPHRTLRRAGLQVERRREPVDGERYSLPDGAVVLECRTADGDVHLGLQPSALTGFLAWLESRPPGATIP